MNLFLQCSYFMLLSLATVTPIAIDNGIVAGPDIKCDAHSLILKSTTRNPFSGRLYIKGESSNPECSVNYTRKASNNITISIPLTSCNVKRLRVPGGAFEYTTTVVISFHDIFETKVDKAYRIHCLFAQMNNTITAPSIEVSMIPTTETQTQTTGPALCQYEIRRGAVDGPVVRFAIIGEPVYHVWRCDAVNMRMLVKDCYVDDGGGNKVVTIDSHGCAVDNFLIQTPTYVAPGYTIAYTEAHVFKYADRPTVLFQCQVQFCDASDTTCQQITPPICNGTVAPTSAPLVNFTRFNETHDMNITLFNASSVFGNFTNQTDFYYGNRSSFGNLTGLKNASENITFFNFTLPFPTPPPMILNLTNATVGRGRRFRRTAYEYSFDIDHVDTPVWDVISNEFTVMDLDQELKGTDQISAHPLTQRDRSANQEASGQFLSPTDKVRVPSNTYCVPLYEMIIDVGVTIALMIATVAAIGVYWRVKKMRKINYLP